MALYRYLHSPHNLIRLDTPQVGIRRRFGLFDENNGVYFEDNGGTYSYVLRSSVTGIVTETRVYRDDWNGEKFDGNGWTGVTADPTKQQMISINYEWYGAGIVQFAWLMKNETVVSHTFENSNTNPGVWCSTPFLPIRLEIENVTGVAGTHYLYQGSNSLIQEGEPEKLGALESISNPITGTTMPLANTFYPIISLRLKSSNLGAVMLLRSLQDLGHDLSYANPKADVQINFTQPHLYKLHKGQYQIGYTPWESTSMRKDWVERFNQCDEVWATSDWCAEVFKNNGVTKPIYVYPHGIEEKWSAVKRSYNEDEVFKFLHVGEPSPRKSGHTKGMQQNGRR